MDTDLGRIRVSLKTGAECFCSAGTPLGYTLLDFWRWSVSDLVSNATRARLAEFIVAKALGISTDCVRDEWAAYDLVTPEGVKVEVKSAAYIQSWTQKRYSSIQFLTRKTKAWDPETNVQSPDSKRQANVYIFAHTQPCPWPNNPAFGALMPWGLAPMRLAGATPTPPLCGCAVVASRLLHGHGTHNCRPDAANGNIPVSTFLTGALAPRSA